MSSPPFRSAGAVYRLSGGNTFSVPNAPGAAAGDVLVLALFTIFSNSSSDALANGWALIPGLDYDPNNVSFSGISLYWRAATGSEPASYPVVLSGNVGNDLGDAVIMAFEGPFAATKFTVAAPANGASSTNVNIPSVDAAQAGTTLVAFYTDTALNGSGAWTPAAGMTHIVTTPSFAIARMSVAAAGATGVKVATHATAAPWAALAFVINGVTAAVPEVNLAISNLSTPSSLSTVSVGVVAPAAGVKNLIVSNLSTPGALATVAVSVTQVQGTLTSDIFRAWGSPAALVGLTVPRVVALKLDGTLALNLADQVTNGAGRIVLMSGQLVAGTTYMLGTWNADGSARGLKAYTAT
jgi:hypothetical protein